MKNLIIKTSFIIFGLLVTFGAFAQPTPPTPEGVPIDGGLSLLAAAGIGYGVSKYRKYKKK